MNLPNQPDNPQLQTILQALQAGYPYNQSLHELDALQQTAIAQHDLALSIQCSLIKSSLISTTYHLSGELLAQLVKIGTTKGKWSVEVAFDQIEMRFGGEVQALLILLQHGIAVPWQRAYQIIQQADSMQDLGYIALYPHVPSEFQATLLQQLLNQYQHRKAYVYALDLLQFIQNLNPEWQNKFIECIVQAEELRWSWSKAEWPEPSALIPAAWQNSLLEFLQTKAQSDLQHINQELKHILHYWFYLPPDQQQLLYWYPNLEITLQHELTPRTIVSLPQHEQQALLDLFCKAAETPRAISQALTYNLLLLHKYSFPHQQKLLDTALHCLSAKPQWLTPKILDLLDASHHQQLVQQALTYHSRYQDLRTCDQLIALLDYAPNLQPQLINLLLKYITSEPSESQQRLYLALLPYLPNQQQILDQLITNSQKIPDHYESTALQLALLGYCSSEQAQAFSQSLFPQISATPKASLEHFENLLKQHPHLSQLVYDYHISIGDFGPDSLALLEHLAAPQQLQLFQYLLNNQQAFTTSADSIKQNTTSAFFQQITSEQQQQAFKIIQQQAQTRLDTFGIWLLLGLFNIPNYPHHTLIPMIQPLTPAYRLALYSAALPQFTATEQAQLHPQIKATLDQINDRTKLWDYQFSAEMALIISEYLLPEIDQHFQLIYHLYNQLAPSQQQQISQQIWHHIAQNPTWPISEIVQHSSLLQLCAQYFSPPQIEEALEILLADEDTIELADLIPTLNPSQLSRFFASIPQDGALIEYYQIAQQHHQILNQAEHYQNLLAILHRHQSAHSNQWDFIERLNRVAPSLHDHDLHKLYRNSFAQLNSPYLDIEYDYVLTDAIPHLQRVKLFDLDLLLYFVRYSACQQRHDCLRLLTDILPPYLQPLPPHEQQQLAAQITQSVEQIVAAWP